MATSVNFFQPGTDAAADSNAILRQRELAKLLLQQGQQSPSGQVVGGQFVAPSALSYANQLAQALGGAFMSKSADEKEREMGMRLQQQRAGEAQAFMQAASGTPASSREVAGPAAEGQAPPTQTTAAVPGDMNKALAIALGGQNPQLQAMAPEILKRQMADASFQQALQSAGGGGGSGGMASGGASNPAGATTGGPIPGGNTFGLDPAAFALSQSSDPRAAAMAKMIQENSKPIALAEGGTALTRGPNGQLTPGYIAPKTEAGINVVPIAGQPGSFRANPVQGYGQAKADISGQVAGAEAAARDPYSALVKVDTPNGPVMMTPAQARAAAGGGAPAPAPQQGQQPPVRPMAGPAPRGNFTGTAEQIMATIDAQNVPPAVKEEMRRAYAAQVSGNNPAFDAMGTGALPPMEGGGAGRGGQGGAGIPLQTEQSQAYATSRAKSYAEMAPKLQQAGQDAASSLRNLDSLEQLFKDPNVAKGGAAENISSLKNLAASSGVDIKGVGAEQGIQAITNKMALDSRSTAEGGGMPGAMSDADRNFLSNQQPGLNKTPEGRAIIIDNARKLAQRKIEVARMAQRYEQEHGQIDAGFDRQLQEYADKTQMFADKKPTAAPQALDFRALAAQELARRQKGGS